MQSPVAEEFQLKVGSSGGKVDVLMTKLETGKRWTSIGRTLEGNGRQIQTTEIEVCYLNECYETPHHLLKIHYIIFIKTLRTKRIFRFSFKNLQNSQLFYYYIYINLKILKM